MSRSCTCEVWQVNILVISDVVSPVLYDHFDRERFRHVDMVISCGDLPAYYLDFVNSMLNVPCFFVPGNHDAAFEKEPPKGWTALDGKVVSHGGMTMLGFGGSMRYRNGPHQYTEAEMKRRFLLMKPSLWMNGNRVDILVSHAPAYRLGDMEELPHTGFKVFRTILDEYQPSLFIHGHVHFSYQRVPREQVYGRTRIINGFQHHIIHFGTGEGEP